MKKNKADEPIVVLVHIHIYTHGNITRKLPVKLPLSQTSKNVIFSLFHFSFLLCKIGEQEGRTGPAHWDGDY
jgi:hypothetical protein